jgi:hypothetical protein
MNKSVLFVLLVFCLFISATNGTVKRQTVNIDLNGSGRIYEGIGALSAGASSKLLMEYQEPYRSQILDFLFKPKFGASLQHLKVEIGGDVNSTCGTEPSHARTREEFENPKPEYFQRGYEWWLMTEAKKRNPDIYLDCLEWGAPGWIGNGKYYSQDNIDYIIAFIKGARQYHNLKIDYTGIWNERMYDIDFIKNLRKALNENGLKEVKLVAADLCCGPQWKIADDMKLDEELRKSVDVIGDHYTERDRAYNSSENAKSFGIPVWNNEGGPWKGDWSGFEYLVKMYNRDYIEGRMTKNITWSLITSYYNSLSLPNSGLMTANTPWSGFYNVEPAVWAAAHTSQFAVPGWKYVDSACGYLKKGSYVTLKSPDDKDFSIIVETVDTTGTQSVTFSLSKNTGNKLLHVWKSTSGKNEFEKQPDIKVENNRFAIQLDGKSCYSITTTTGQNKGNYQAPEDKPFPFPYRGDFESETIGKLPKYFMDQAGAFEVCGREDGKGKCLKQILEKQGIEWETGLNPAIETVLGDTTWTDYEVQVDVNIPGNTGHAKLLGRAMEMYRGGDFPEGYIFVINTGNRWALYAGKQIIATGNAKFPAFTWHHISMKLKGKMVSVWLNNKELISVTNDKYSHGLAGIGSGFNYAEFDNFLVGK